MTVTDETTTDTEETEIILHCVVHLSIATGTVTIQGTTLVPHLFMVDLDVIKTHGRGLDERTTRGEMTGEGMCMNLNGRETENGTGIEQGHILLEGLLHLLGHTVSKIHLFRKSI